MSRPKNPAADERAEDFVRRSHMRLELRAIANGWATPEREKRTIVARLLRVCKANSPEGKAAKLHYVLAAARTLISADLHQQRLELEREIAQGTVQEGTLAELVAAAEQIANEIDRTNRTGRRLEGETSADGRAGA